MRGTRPVTGSGVLLIRSDGRQGEWTCRSRRSRSCVPVVVIVDQDLDAEGHAALASVALVVLRAVVAVVRVLEVGGAGLAPAERDTIFRKVLWYSIIKGKCCSAIYYDHYQINCNITMMFDNYDEICGRDSPATIE